MRVLIIAVLIMVFGSCKSDLEQTNNSSLNKVEIEKNKELVNRLFRDFASKKNMSFVDSLYADNIFDHSAFEGQEQGLAGFKKAVAQFSDMFSHIELKIDDIVAERDVVSTRESWKVIRASDKKEVTGETMHWFRIKNGKITDEWSKGWEWLGPMPSAN